MKTIVAFKDNRIIGFWHHDSHNILKNDIHIYRDAVEMDANLEDAKHFVMKRGEPGIEMEIRNINLPLLSFNRD